MDSEKSNNFENKNIKEEYVEDKVREDKERDDRRSDKDKESRRDNKDSDGRRDYKDRESRRDNKDRDGRRDRGRERDTHERTDRSNRVKDEEKLKDRNGDRGRDRHGKDDSRRSKERRGRDHRSRSNEKKDKYDSSAEFKRSYKYWDVPPTGYESIAPAEFKAMQAAGQVMPTMYTTEDTTMNLGMDANMSMGNAMSRQNRRVYVGNIPLGITEQGLMDFFNEKLKTPSSFEGDPVIAVQINVDKNFAFLEFRSVDETNTGLTLDGVMYQGFPLKLKRPRDYVALPAEYMSLSSVPGIVQDTPHKLFVGGLPHYLNEEQVKEILVNFGQLSGFNLVKDATTGLSKGYAFCEYADHSMTDQACMGLTGIQLGDKKIIVQRASLGSKNPTVAPVAALMLARTQQMTMNPSLGPAGKETEILCLHNMIAAQDLVDDDEYEEIVEDIKEECSRYGHVVSVQIPRPSGSVDDTSGGVGKVFVEFSDKSETVKAMKALAGRTFSGRVVVASFYEPEKYRNGFF